MLFTRTDDTQWVCRVGHRTYDCIEVEDFSPATGDWLVVRKMVCLNDYNDETLDEYVTASYKSRKALIDEYGNDTADQLCAECVFEQTQVADMDERWVFKNEDDAASFAGCLVQELDGDYALTDAAANYMIVTGCERTIEGSYTFMYEDIAEHLGISMEKVGKIADGIVNELLSHGQIQDEDGVWCDGKSFSLKFFGHYCGIDTED